MTEILLGAVGVLAAAVVALLAGWSRERGKRKDAEGYQRTLERMSDENWIDPSVSDARDRLRKRADKR